MSTPEPDIVFEGLVAVSKANGFCEEVRAFCWWSFECRASESWRENCRRHCGQENGLEPVSVCALHQSRVNMGRDSTPTSSLMSLKEVSESASILEVWNVPCRTIRCSALVCVLLQYRQLSLRVAVSVAGRAFMPGLEERGSQL